MNVVLVNDHASIKGGASNVAIRSAIGLKRAGIDVRFFAGCGPIEEDLAASEIPVTLLDQRPYNERGNGVIAGLWDRNAKQSLDALLASLPLKDTLVHVHSHRDCLSNSVIKSVLDAGIQLVYSCHEYGLACPYAGFYDHRQNAICVRKPLSGACLAAHCNRKGYAQKLWTYTRGAIQNGFLHLPERASDVIFVSEFSRQVLEPFVGSDVRCHVIANPVLANPNRSRDLKADSPFLFVGLLTPGKDPVLAARAAAQAGVPIRLIGDGELREDVLRANPDAIVTGWLSSDEVREEMLRARALVFPVKWYETQGLVVQEAAAVGLPSIVSRTSAAREMVDDGCSGILISPADEEDLVRAMLRLGDDAEAIRMGHRAFERFWERPPTLDAHVDALLNVYKGALSSAQ